MQSTPIEWATHTSNPIIARDKRTGKRGWFCTKVSPGCQLCYAENLNHWRGNELDFSAQNEQHVTFEINMDECQALLKRKQPARVFVFDMGDLFHHMITQAQLEYLFSVFLRVHPSVHLLLLTKRIDRAYDVMVRSFNTTAQGIVNFLPADKRNLIESWPPENIHIGTSVEDQRRLHERAPVLNELARAGWTTYFSCEPIRAPIDFEQTKRGTQQNYLRDPYGNPLVHGVIAGGESGRGALPMHPELVRTLRDQCTRHRIPFFFKQWGAWAPRMRTNADGSVEYDGDNMDLVGKANSGNTLDGRQHLHIPNHRCAPITQEQWLQHVKESAA